MNVRKTGILIETGRPKLKVSKVNSYNKQQEKKQYTSYIEMAHKDDEGGTVVTPLQSISYVKWRNKAIKDRKILKSEREVRTLSVFELMIVTITVAEMYLAIKMAMEA